MYPPTGNPHWSKVGVAGLVKNPVYLGQARSGKIVKEHAHEPIVTRAEFDAAQATKNSLLKPRDGSLASQALLGGLARCAGCGHTLKITGNRRTRPAALPDLLLRRPLRVGLCPARASARASALDDYVEERVLTRLRRERADCRGAGSDRSA